MQSAKRIFMVRPANFGFNPQTAVSNSFQKEIEIENTQALALREFDAFVSQLHQANIDVHVAQDSIVPPKPDAVFPNNWFSFHESGDVFIYPMLTENRRKEVRLDTLFHVLGESHRITDLRIDFSEILEGTGSLVLDRQNKIAYACLSERTSLNLFLQWCRRMEYSPVYFSATNAGVPIYHTNVLMTITTDFVMVCLECVSDKHEQMVLKESLIKSGRRILEISIQQMNHFCGNALEVLNMQGEKYFICSRTAFNNYNEQQLKIISSFCEIIVADIPTIESIGGGSARCMLAEIF
jgi:hypothetical protein